MPLPLSDWLVRIQQQHPQAIAMGLERVRAVAQAMGLAPKPAPIVITVGGTNGKGSTVAFLEAIARAAGLRVGTYTSPHVWRFNERIRIEGVDADDAAIAGAFERIDAARGDTPITYFEYATLAAFDLFERAGLDLAILEVGLGGRLDATNLVDADVAVITTVDLDHMDYLGPDRESIGAEKAGILRAGKIAVFGEKDPPSSVLRRAYALGAIAIRGHSDYLVDRFDEHWVWREPGFELALPYPTLAAPVQVDNAAAAVAALRASPLAIPDDAFARGVVEARAPGRLQRVAESPDVVLDVAHNPQGARQLAAWLAVNPKPTVAVFAALGDKDIEGVVAPLVAHIDAWHLGPITDAGPRGLTVDALAVRVRAGGAAVVSAHASLAEALQAARLAVGARGRVLVFGSFHTVAAVAPPPA
ncbi:MAG: bifunctional tetrahydrofolate synthase/dihydrofolate synthase [Silanimonas sp.]